MPICMMLIIDKVVTQGAENTLKALLAGVALLTVFQYLFLCMYAVHGARRSELDAHGKRAETFQALLACRSGGRWISLGWDVVSSCLDGSRFQVETLPQFVVDCCYVVLLAVLMAAFNPWLLLVSAAFLPLYLGVDVWGGRRARHYLTTCTDLRNGLSARYFESVAEVETIRALNLADHAAARWRDADAALAANRYQAGLYARLSALGVEFLQKVSLILVALVGVGAVIDGTMTLGQFIAFNLLSMQFGQPVLRMAAFRRARDDHGVTAQARSQLAEHCSGDTWETGGALPLPAQQHSTLHVDRIVVAADGGQKAGAISFAVAPGSWLGITGPSGCGKSSLMRVAAGLDRPASGQVRVDGLAVTDIDRSYLARQVRLVGQRAAVFSASIAENLRLGDPAASPRQIAAAARVCGVLEIAEKLPGHLDALVGPSGHPLSGGERQRIALARSVLSRPSVLLLDEATAALDPAGETALFRKLRAFLPDAAVVLVAHRASSLAHCGRVLRMGMPAAAGDTPPVVAAAAG
jgi:ABC-type bacteriocin/lantibiotic exporter with double-glycine peptidase domain